MVAIITAGNPLYMSDYEACRGWRNATFSAPVALFTCLFTSKYFLAILVHRSHSFLC